MTSGIASERAVRRVNEIEMRVLVDGSLRVEEGTRMMNREVGNGRGRGIIPGIDTIEIIAIEGMKSHGVPEAPRDAAKMIFVLATER